MIYFLTQQVYSQTGLKFGGLHNVINRVMDRDNRWEELFEPLAQHLNAHDVNGHPVGLRRDVLSVLNFMVVDLQGNALIHDDQISVAERFIVFRTPTVHDAVRLFWDVYKPQLDIHTEIEVESELTSFAGTEDAKQKIYERLNPPAPASSEQLDQLLLRCLDWVYEKFQVPYEPDSDSADKLLSLIIEFHIAATRAFKLNQIEAGRTSEEWMSSLRSIEGTLERINIIEHPFGSRYWDPSYAVSTDAIWGMTQLGLSRISRLEGSYEDSLDRLARAGYALVEAHDSLWSLKALHAIHGVPLPGYSDEVDPHGGNPWTSAVVWDEETIKAEEIPTRNDIQYKLAALDVTLDEAASLFRLLKQAPGTDAKWRGITEDCEGLAVIPGMEWNVFTGINDFVDNDDGNLVLSWSEFWHSAGAWASSQLSPGNLAEFLQKKQETEAGSRLENYFFGSIWSRLPVRARERMVNADMIWNAAQRGSGESILNELLRATEEMCDRFLYQSLMNEETLKSSIINIEARIAKRHNSLGVREYIKICELSKLPDLLSERGLTSREIRFVIEVLPASMGQLTDARNSGEHDPGITVSRVLVDSAYRLFVGIGQAGVLCQLAQIGLKLERSGPSKRP